MTVNYPFKITLKTKPTVTYDTELRIQLQYLIFKSDS